MLGVFCVYSLYVMLAHEKRIFCDHNRSCCLVCGESLVQFDAPDDHTSYKALTVCGNNNMCTKTPTPKFANGNLAIIFGYEFGSVIRHDHFT